MNSGNRPYHEEFEQLVAQIRSELQRLKQDNSALRQENEVLKQELQNHRSDNGDLFSHLDESERLALRQHIKDLITRIDTHINERQ